MPQVSNVSWFGSMFYTFLCLLFVLIYTSYFFSMNLSKSFTYFKKFNFMFLF